MVEDGGDGEPYAGGVVEAVAQFDGGERVEAQRLERPVGADLFGAVVAEHGGGLGAHQLDEGAPALGLGQRGEAVAEFQGGALGGGPAEGTARAHQTPQQRGHGVRRAGLRQVEADGHGERPVESEGRVEEGEAGVGGQRAHAGPADALEVDLVEDSGHGAGVGPQAPGHGVRGQALGAAVLCEGVEERVGRRVVALAGGAEDAGGGGEQDEEVEVRGEFVQVPGGVGLGPQDGVQALGGERGDHAVVQHAGRVDDAAQSGQPGDQRGGRVPVGHVAGDDAGVGAEFGEFRGEFGGAGGVRAAAAGEHQLGDAVLGDQVAGDGGAEDAGAAGDQDGSLAVAREGRGLGVADPAEAGHQGGALAQGGLRLPGGGRGRDGGGQRGAGGVRAVEVDLGDAAGVFGGGRADQAARRRRGYLDGLAGGGGGAALGEDDEVDVVERVVGQDRAEGLQDVDRRVPGGARGTGGGVRGVRHGQEHGVRCGGTLGDGGAERIQVGEDGGALRRGGPAQEGVAGGALCGGAVRERGPGHLVQRGQCLRGSGGLGGVERPGGDLLDGEDGAARGVGQEQLDRVGADGPQAYADGGGVGGVQFDAGEGRGRRALGGLERGVDQGGVHAEPRGVPGGGLGQFGLGEDVAAAVPDAAQAAEDRAVGESGGGEASVQLLGVGLGGAGGRPGAAQFVGGAGAGAGAEGAGGVQGPGAVRVAVGVGAREDADAALAAPVRGVHDDLYVDRGVGQHEVPVDLQVREAVGAEVLARVQGEFEEDGGGDDGAARGRVVGEPGVGVGAEAAGADVSLAVGERDARGQERVGERGEPGARDVGGAGRAVQPVAAALEGVRGQADALVAAAGEHGLPVGLHAVRPQLGEGGEEAARAALVAAQGADGGDLGVERAAGVLDGGGQHGVGAGLDEGGAAVADEGLDGVVEADGLAQVAEPVLGVGGAVGEEFGGDRGVHRHLGRARRHRGREVEERLAQLLDLRGVGGVVHGDAAGPHLVVLAGGHQLVQGRGLAGDDGGLGSVDRGDVDAAVPGGDELLGGGAGQRQGDHAALAREFAADEAAAQRHDAGRVLQREHVGDDGGGQFALGVAHDGGRLDAVAAPQVGQGDHDGPQHRLDDVHPVQGRRALPLVQDVGGHPVDVRGERGGALREAVRELRRGREEFGGHARPLGALAGEDEDDVGGGLAGACAGDDSGGGLAVLQRGEARRELVGVGAEEHGAVFEARAGQREGAADGGGGGLGGGGELPQGGGLSAQSGGRPSGERPQQDAAGGDDAGRGGLVGRCGGLGVGGLGGRRLLDDDVGVGAAHAEGGHTGAAGLAGVRPGAALGDQLDGAGGPVHVRGGLVHVQRLGDGAVADGLDHLDDAGDARGGLGVADVGLHRAEQHGPFPGPLLAVGGEQGVGLDGVAEGGAGAVRLDDVDLRGGEPGGVQGLADDALLGGAVGRGEAVGGAVLVDGGAADDGEDLVAVAARVGEPLHQEQADALAEAGAVGAVGERAAAAVAGEPLLAAEPDEHLGRRHDHHAAGERQRALAALQGADRQVEGDQGGRAGRVDGECGALKAQGVGDPPGDDAVSAPGEEVALHLVGGGGLVAVPVEAGAHEDAGVAAAQARRVDAGALEQLPGGLQEEALLGVHGEGLARRDPEEGRVELGGLVQESAFGDVRRAGALARHVELARHVPAAVEGDAGDGVGAVGHQPPEFLGRGDAAGVTAAHADDRHGFGGRRLHLAQP